MEILGFDLRIYFLLFMIYAVIGWCLEVTCKLIQYKRFINRGFLIGPYCPIYGYGAILITVLLQKYTADPWGLFVMAILICGTLEYLTSLFMEKIFKARWWDYSQRKFNLNGRICLGTIIPFGILGLFIMYVSNPFLLEKLEQIPEVWLNWISGIAFGIYIVDNIVSTVVIRYVKKAELIAGKDLDNTEEMTSKVKEILNNKSALHRRLVNAYPTLVAIKTKITKKTEEIKRNIVEQKDEITKKVEDTAEKVKKTAKKKLLQRVKKEITMTYKFEVPGTIVGKERPRVNTYTLTVYTPNKTKDYENLIIQYFYINHPGAIAFEGRVKISVIAYFKIPKSTSKKDREKMIANEISPTKKPDADNIGKVVLDALNKVAFKDDNQVSSLFIEKRYSEDEEKIEIEVNEY